MDVPECVLRYSASFIAHLPPGAAVAAQALGLRLYRRSELPHSGVGVGAAHCDLNLCNIYNLWLESDQLVHTKQDVTGIQNMFKSSSFTLSYYTAQT